MGDEDAPWVFEPFVHLVDVTESSALIAWGGFHLVEDQGRWRTVEKPELVQRFGGDGETIGARCPTYGPALVEALDAAGDVVARTGTDTHNHAWVEGLSADTDYRYRITVDGTLWASGERLDWVPGPGENPGDGGSLRRCGRSYDMRFRTHPIEDDPATVQFLAMSDYGVGITQPEFGQNQLGVARSMAQLAATRPIRFILSMGDTIYHGPGGEADHSGACDDDWYFTFYQPYRYLIDHLPLYPAIGNHDTADTEQSDDRDQLADNFHTEARFARLVEQGRASCEPGLYYRVRIGRDLELISVDTTCADPKTHTHFFDDEHHRRWLEDAFAPASDESPGPAWRIPFCHHPPFCAGPKHTNMPSQIERLVPLYRKSGVRVVLCGHEHNFQYAEIDGLACVQAGAGAKVRKEPPGYFAEAHTVAWSPQAHCLLGELDGERLRLTAVGPSDGIADPRPISLQRPDGTEHPGVIELSLPTRTPIG